MLLFFTKFTNVNLYVLIQSYIDSKNINLPGYGYSVRSKLNENQSPAEKGQIRRRISVLKIKIMEKILESAVNVLVCAPANQATATAANKWA